MMTENDTLIVSVPPEHTAQSGTLVAICLGSGELSDTAIQDWIHSQLVPNKLSYHYEQAISCVLHQPGRYPKV